MRVRHVAVLLVGAAAGCGAESGKLPEPIPTDGPNQVVVFVPGMT
jgi:hypothetical protein